MVGWKEREGVCNTAWGNERGRMKIREMERERDGRIKQETHEETAYRGGQG